MARQSPAAAPFDLAGLHRAVDAERQLRGLSWAALAREIGVAASTIRRFATADDAEADGVLLVVRWLNAAPEDFVPGGRVSGKRLPSVEVGYVRVDMALLASANGEQPDQRRTRTTVQRLVGAAQRSGQPVAALTRISET